MSRCILHVGMHKTGTSSIQQSLSGLDSEGFLYLPGLNGRSNHGRTIRALLDGGIDLPDIRGRTLIVSNEGMMLFEPDLLSGLASYLRTHGFDWIDVVAYVRPPGSYMTSMTNQATRGTAMRTPIEPEPGSGLEIRGQPRYRAAFEKIDQAFGRSNVTLCKFDPAKFLGGDVVRDFCSRLGISLPAGRIVRAQESLSREVVGLLYAYRKFSREWDVEWPRPPANRALIESLTPVGSTRFRISPEVLRPIIERNRADIGWMEDRLGASLDEADEEHPDDVRTEEELMRPSGETIARLIEMFDGPAPPSLDTPEGVARFIDQIAMRPDIRSASRRNLRNARAQERKHTRSLKS